MFLYLLKKMQMFIEYRRKIRYNNFEIFLKELFMSYTKFRNITKRFYFSKVLEKKELPAYARQYIKNEKVLTIYKTERDHGIFTDKKIVLFDNKGSSKQIYTIPYKSISNPSISFNDNIAELNLYMDSGYPVTLKFINMDGTDKLRLRVLYTCIDKIINNQEPIKEDMDALINNTIKL